MTVPSRFMSPFLYRVHGADESMYLLRWRISSHRDLRARENWKCSNCVWKLAMALCPISSTSRSRSVSSPHSGTTPPKYLCVMDRLREKRLPRSLARSALKRPTRASSLKDESWPKLISDSRK